MKYWKKKQNKISLKESIKKGRKKKDLKIQSRIFMYARIWPILIYFHWTNASSITVEGNKKERKTETGDWRSEISLKESKKKGRKKKKGLKIQSRIFTYARIWPILIYFHWTDASSTIYGRQVKQRETGNGGSFRLCGTYRKFTMPRWLRQRHHHDTFDCCHPPRRYRACVSIWTWKINLLPLPIGALPSSPRTRAHVCIYMYLSSDNPHSSHDNKRFRETYVAKTLYIYTYNILWKRIFIKLEN